MRHGRAKAGRKTLQFFARAIELTQKPYHILLDGPFCVSICQYNITDNIQDRLHRLMNHEEFECFILQETITEMEAIYKSLQRNPNKQDKVTLFETTLAWINSHCTLVPTCKSNKSKIKNNNKKQSNDNKSNDNNENDKNDNSSSISAANAIYELIQQTNDRNNQKSKDKLHHKVRQPFLVASQDEELLDSLRQIGIVPIIRLANHSVLLLEQPSKACQMKFQQGEQVKWKRNKSNSDSKEKELVQLIKQEQKEKRQQQHVETLRKTEYQRRHMKKKAKGPNPLSCKKKKNTKREGGGGGGGTEPPKKKSKAA